MNPSYGPDKPPGIFFSNISRIAISALALCGFGINLMLFVRHLSGGGLAGCGGGSGCWELLNSRWSQVLGIPATAFGCLVYLVLMVSFTIKARWLLAPCIGLIVGAAAWFIFLQAVVIGRFCPWCMTAHSIGLVIALWIIRRNAVSGTLGPAIWTMGLAASGAVISLGLLQVLGPKPVTHRIDDVSTSGKAQSSSIHARGSGRKVEFDGGRKVYDVSALPHLGRPNATRVLVEYFDYSCLACQTMRGYLDALITKHPVDICVVVLPVPLDASCNHSLGFTESEHPDSCAIARYALALWRTKPEAFAAFHHALLNGLSLAEAKTRASQFVPKTDLDAAMRDPWIDELIQADIHDWVSFSVNTRNLPKLLISDKRILHGLPSGEADFIRVMERELGL